jgi:hypothetical protein
MAYELGLKGKGGLEVPVHLSLPEYLLETYGV